MESKGIQVPKKCTQCDYLAAEVARLKEKVGFLQVEAQALEINLRASENANEDLRMRVVDLVDARNS